MRDRRLEDRSLKMVVSLPRAKEGAFDTSTERKDAHKDHDTAAEGVDANTLRSSDKHQVETAQRRKSMKRASPKIRMPWWGQVSLCGRPPRKPRKPPSNPPGWAAGRATDYDVAKRPNRVVVFNDEQETDFVANMVRTSKYNYYTFLPMFLWEEFNPATKIANVYFLFIAALQVIPAITNTFGIPLMLLPLFFVVFVDAVFMIIEDVTRHRADRFANSSPTRVWDCEAGAFKTITWKEIEVGDLIVINNREAIPCDLLIVGVNEPVPQTPAGIAYVETKSLDGETNLKIRQVVKGTLGAFIKPEDCASLRGRVVMEHPDKLINNFKGKLILETARAVSHRRPSSQTTNTAPNSRLTANTAAKEWDNEEVTVRRGEDRVDKSQEPEPVLAGVTSEPIAPDMLLLRGCVLRNTRWVIGLVLNTGPDTKIMMSMSEAPCKASHLSKRINEEIKRVAGVMAGVCILGATASTIWNAKYLGDKWYLSWEGSAAQLAELFFTQMLYYALLLNSFIPISLYVSMNFVRFLQAWFMNQDLDMYYAPADTPARVRTMNLNEDLGQVSHIFSDKTGTLTCNIMDFRKFSVGGVSYGLGITEIGRAAMVVEGGQVPAHVLAAEEKAKDHVAPHVNFYDPSAYRDLTGRGEGGENQARRMRDFFMALAVCHTVIPEKFEDSSEAILSASSPDDEALVLGAKYFGFEFAGRVNSNAVINTWPVKSAPSAQRSTSPRAAPSSKATSPRSPRRGSIFSVGALSPRWKGNERNSEGDQFQPSTSSLGDLRRADSASVVAAQTGALNTTREGSRPEEATPRRRTNRSGSVGAILTAATKGFGKENQFSSTPEVTETPDQRTVSPVNFEVLHLLGFTSDRKRMSVIVRTEDGTIKVICKGADTVMLPRLRTDYPGAKDCIDATVRHMDTFAKEGLRTLVVAQAELEPDSFEEWADQFEEASNDLVEIEKRNRGEPNRIESIMDRVERNLEVVGSSAIEDKLQAGVADTMSDLMAAGIKIWVLTGDKEETAINIAVACQLLWTEEKMHRTVINLRDTESAEPGQIQAALEDFLHGCIEERDAFDRDTTGTIARPLPRGLVIDGPALLEALRTPESQCALLRAAQTCHCVVGCRMSPDQKRALVSLVRENVPGTRTLSIGDGANDVPMIQTAHIGVGISGQEGMQAVNASDYAISQFAYLRKLLLVHGRWNYRRSSRVVCYLFYKSIMFAGPLIFYAAFNGFSGTLFYDYVTTNLYAVVYTALPILLYGVYDQDISAETCLRFPQLYSYGIQDGYMRPRIFWSWMLQALLESAFMTIMPLLLLTGDRKAMGVVTSTYDYGTATFALVVITVSFKMFWVQNRWTSIHLLALAGSVLAFFFSAFVVNTSVLLNWDFVGVLDALLQSGQYWAVSMWCLVVVVGRDWTWKFNHRWWHPRLHHLVIESEKADVRAMKDKPKKSPLSDSKEGKLKPPLDQAGCAEDTLEAGDKKAERGNDRDDEAEVLVSIPEVTVNSNATKGSWTNDRTESSYEPCFAQDSINTKNNDDNDNASVASPASLSINALAETLREKHPAADLRSLKTPQHEFSQPFAMDINTRFVGVASSADGMGDGGRNRWAKTFGWVESHVTPRFGGSPSSTGTEHKGGFSTTAPAALHRQTSARTMRISDLGRDPREAAKLMSKSSFFVEVPGITCPHPPQASPGTLRFNVSSRRRNSDRSGGAVSTSTSASPSRRASEGVSRLSVTLGSEVLGISNVSGAGAPNIYRGASGSHREKSCCSPGGFAFSCDPQAQRAEIAMILGERPSPMKHSASFYEHRSSLRAQRLGRVRTAGASVIMGNAAAEERGVEEGPGERALLQRRNSYNVIRERESSTSTTSMAPTASTSVDSIDPTSPNRELPPLRLIVEEKTKG